MPAPTCVSATRGIPGTTCPAIVSVKPKDRERAEKCVLDAAIPVLEEMGYEYTSEELAKELESSECGEGENKKVHIYLKVFDLDYDPDAIDADEKIQELAEWFDTVYLPQHFINVYSTANAPA